MKTALILGNYRPSFILARSLAQRGYKVVCSLRGYDRGAEVSRYVHAIWDDMGLTDYSDKFQVALDDFLSNHPDIQLVFPVTEEFVRAFAERRLTLPENVMLGSMPDEIVNQCFDKSGLLKFADELGVPVAPFAVTQSAEELRQEATRIGFPLVVRPLDSTIELAGKKAVTCTSLEHLLSLYDTWLEDNPGLLIQRYVSGKRDNIYFAAHEGVIYRYLHAKIERTNQPDGSGLALEGVTVTPCTHLRDYTERLIKALDYSGIGCAQYLVDSKTGEQNFLEINPRLAGNHALPEACGLNLGDWLIDQTIYGLPDKSQRHGQQGVRYTWLAGELAAIKRAHNLKKLDKWSAVKASLHAVKVTINSDMDMGLMRGDIMPGLITLCDSFPVLGRVTRRRLEKGLIRRLLINKVQLT